MADVSTRLVILYGLVQNRGPLDYKQQGKQFEDFGNFNYGVVGAALGFDKDLLLRAAGWAQLRAGTSMQLPSWGQPPKWILFGGKPPYGDDPRDQQMISNGFEYYHWRKAGCD